MAAAGGRLRPEAEAGRRPETLPEVEEEDPPRMPEVLRGANEAAWELLPGDVPDEDAEGQASMLGLMEAVAALDGQHESLAEEAARLEAPS